MVDGVRTPPNNWKGCFGGSVWEWDELTEEVRASTRARAAKSKLTLRALTVLPSCEFQLRVYVGSVLIVHLSEVLLRRATRHKLGEP